MNEAAGYGIREADDDAASCAVHAERIRMVGYSILDGGFTEAALADLRTRLDAVLDEQIREFGGMERLAEIGDSNTVRCPLVHDDAFLHLAAHPMLLALCRQLLGDYIVLMQQNGVINLPTERHTQAAYHRDFPYQHFVSSRPLGISAIFCLDRFRVETGATTVLPGSHRVERFPSAETAATLDTTVEADSGSFIVFDSMLFHRAGRNGSGLPRRAVNHVFTVPIIAQQISLPDALQGRHADDPHVRQLLGYDTAPARSVTEWRQRRRARQTARATQADNSQ